MKEGIFKKYYLKKVTKEEKKKKSVDFDHLY